jgi:hypothetical protein
MADMGAEFEKLAIGDLKERNVRMKQCKMSDVAILQRTDSFFILNEERRLVIISTTNQEGYDDINRDVFRKTNTFAEPPKGFGLIDAAGPGRWVYQCTVSHDHKVSFSEAKMLLIGAKLLKYVDGELQLSQPMGNPLIISFYWMVPPGRFGDWRKKAAKGVEGKNSQVHKKAAKGVEGTNSKVRNKAAKGVEGTNSQDWNVVSNCWKRHVVQYCLEVPYICGQTEDV